MLYLRYLKWNVVFYKGYGKIFLRKHYLYRSDSGFCNWIDAYKYKKQIQKYKNKFLESIYRTTTLPIKVYILYMIIY